MESERKEQGLDESGLVSRDVKIDGALRKEKRGTLQTALRELPTLINY